MATEHRLTINPFGHQKPLLLRYRSSKWFILFAVCFASFSDAFTYGVIIPVIPISLRARSGIYVDHIQQRVSELLAVFGAAECIGAPFFGWLIDRSGSRKAPFLFGFILNAGATALLCFARDINLLLFSRALQGLSAAIVYTVGFALLADTIGSKRLGEWMGYNILSVNVGITISPTIGGVLYDHAGYYPVFGFLAGLIALDILLRFALVEKKTAELWIKREEAPESQDESTAKITTSDNYCTFEPGPEATVHEDHASTDAGPPEAGPSGWSQQPIPSADPETDRAVLEGSQSEPPASHSTDIPSERSSLLKPSPSFGPQETESDETTHYPPIFMLLTSPRILADLYAVLVNVILLASFDSALPLFLERTFGFGSSGSGLMFLVITLPILGAPLAGKLTDKYQSPWIPIVGFLLVAGLTLLLALVKQNSNEQIALLASLLFLNGCVRVVSSTPLGADLYRAVKEMEEDHPGAFGKTGAYGQVFSLYTMASAAGVLLGPLWTGFAYGDGNWTLLVGTLGAFCGSVTIPLLISNTLRKSRKERQASPSLA